MLSDRGMPGSPNWKFQTMESTSELLENWTSLPVPVSVRPHGLPCALMAVRPLSQFEAVPSSRQLVRSAHQTTRSLHTLQHANHRPGTCTAQATTGNKHWPTGVKSASLVTLGGGTESKSPVNYSGVTVKPKPKRFVHGGAGRRDFPNSQPIKNAIRAGPAI